MPNHITNVITITAPDKEKYEKLKEIVTEDSFDFSKVLPYPKKFDDLDKIARDYEEKHGWTKDKPKDGYNQGGYEWCIANWGTKWNSYEVCGVDFDDDSLSVSFEFQTAWSPPEGIYDALDKLGYKIDGLWKDEGDWEVHQVGDGGDWYADVTFQRY